MAEFYKNTYPTSADNVSAGYPLGSFWNNMVSYDVYEHVVDGEWYWRKQDGMLANIEIPEQLNKTSSIPELDLMITGLTNRVTVLENKAFDVLYLDYWGNDSTLPIPSKSGLYAITYQNGEVNPLVVSKVYVSDENLNWIELVGYLLDDNSLNRVYINRTTNLQYSWSGSIMIALTVPLEFASKTDAETGTNDSKVMTPLKTSQSFDYNVLNKTFTGFTTTSKVIQGAINETWDGIFNRPMRTVALPAYEINAQSGEIFTKTAGTNSQFTIINPVLYKTFYLRITGGTLNADLFSGYTETWILNSLVTDYVPANTNILACQIRSAGVIHLFWSE